MPGCSDGNSIGVCIMYQKRARESENGQETGQGSEAPATEAVDNNAKFPGYLEEFVLNEKDFFSRLVNLDYSDSIKKYVNLNLDLSDYFCRLRDAIFLLSKSVVDPKMAILRKTKNMNTKKIKNELDCEQLVKVLHKAATPEARDVIQLLNDGMQTWQLPLFLDLHLLSLGKDSQSETKLQALTWIEQRRGFIQSVMNREPKITQWLNEDQQADMKSILVAFTDAMHQLLTEEVEINFGSGYVRKTPLMMDIRALWHTLSFKDVTDGEDRDNDSQLLHLHNRKDLINKGYIAHFLEVSASPWVCFLEIFNGPAETLHPEDVLRVTGDVLAWLLITHPENEILAQKIMRHAISVDWVCEAYERYQKQEHSSLLAASMSTVLQAVHNSPTKPGKKRELEEEKTSPLTVSRQNSPLKKPCVEDEVDTQQNLQPRKLSATFG